MSYVLHRLQDLRRIMKAGIEVSDAGDPKYGVYEHQLAGQPIGHTVKAVHDGTIAWTAVPTNGNIKGKFKSHDEAKQYLADQHGEGIKTTAIQDAACQQQQQGNQKPVKKDEESNGTGDDKAASSSEETAQYANNASQATATSDKGEVISELNKTVEHIAKDWSQADKLNDGLKKREFSDKEREKLAYTGHAMPGGGYPINTVQDLHNAIQAIGRAKNPSATRAHIRRRAKALGASDAIPDSWGVSKLEEVEAAIERIEKDWSKFDADRATGRGRDSHAALVSALNSHGGRAIGNARRAHDLTLKANTPTSTKEDHLAAMDAHNKAAKYLRNLAVRGLPNNHRDKELADAHEAIANNHHYHSLEGGVHPEFFNED